MAWWDSLVRSWEPISGRGKRIEFVPRADGKMTNPITGEIREPDELHFFPEHHGNQGLEEEEDEESIGPFIDAGFSEEEAHALLDLGITSPGEADAQDIYPRSFVGDESTDESGQLEGEITFPGEEKEEDKEESWWP